jgi:hypothetical protein
MKYGSGETQAREWLLAVERQIAELERVPRDRRDTRLLRNLKRERRRWRDALGEKRTAPPGR